MSSAAGPVRVLFFASLRDVVGSPAVEHAVPPGGTVADLSASLVAAWPGLAERLHLARVAVNERIVGDQHPVAPGDEVAYLPAVSGGAPEAAWVRVTDDEIAVDEVLRAVRRPACGASVLFLGTVRDSFRGRAVLGLEYQAHRALAERMLLDVAEETLARGAHAVALVHRLGAMEVGDTSVAVAVSAPHRPAAFEAGRYAIDRLKSFVPIWKKELFADGSVWVEGEDRVPSTASALPSPPRAAP